MPAYLKTLSWLLLAATALSALVIVAGPQEGLEALGGALLAYFVLLFHIAVGPVYLWVWWQNKRFSFGLALMLVYLLVIYGLGFSAWLVSNDMDDKLVDRISEHSDADAYRLRELGEAVFFEHLSGQTLAGDTLAEMRYLASQAAAPFRRDRARQGVLWYAAGIGDVDLLETLLARGAPPADPALYDSPPLSIAVTRQHLEVVKRLLAAGADPDGAKGFRPAITLTATRHGHPELLEALLTAGADPNRGQPPPLWQATQEQRSELVSLLLQHGAEQRAYSGQVPIQIALENNDQATIALLSAAGGFDKVAEGVDALLFGILQRCDLARFEALLQLGARPDVLNRRGYSVFQETILMNYRGCEFDRLRPQFAAALIRAGADINQHDPHGNSALVNALRTGRTEIAQQLVAAGADLSGEYAKANVLALAAGAGQHELVDIALSAGFDINHWIGGLNGKSALYMAIREQQADTVRYLVERGATLPEDTTKRRQLFRMAGAAPATLQPLLDVYLAVARDKRMDDIIKRSVADADNPDSMAMLKAAGL